jgi:dTDP-4-dehydrorhamnose reductase
VSPSTATSTCGPRASTSTASRWALFDLVERGTTGLLNLAARESTSKLDFIQSLAQALGHDAGLVRPARLNAMCGTPRANALGLDVARAEALLGRRLPGATEVVQHLARLCLKTSPKTNPNPELIPHEA